MTNRSFAPQTVTNHSPFTTHNSLKTAFTLAEVLITLAIIGVVAAMTIPAMIQKQVEKQTVVKLKKAYATLSNAYRLAQVENGEDFRRDLDWTSCDTYKRPFLKALMPYLDIAADCKDNPKLCFTSKLHEGLAVYDFKLDSPSWFGDFKNQADSSVLLKDGTLIVISTSGYCIPSVANVQILVDVNGPKKPNRYGHDAFWFHIAGYRNTGYSTAGKLLPVSAWDYSYDRGMCKLNSSQQATGCAWWVLANENMDYLHCDVEKNQTKCSDKK